MWELACWRFGYVADTRDFLWHQMFGLHTVGPFRGEGVNVVGKPSCTVFVIEHECQLYCE